jgi:hypothetical protein
LTRTVVATATAIGGDVHARVADGTRTDAAALASALAGLVAGDKSACHGPAVLIGGQPRCAGCGHRQPAAGVPPRRTREQSPVTWLAELRDRRRARLAGRKPAARREGAR